MPQIGMTLYSHPDAALHEPDHRMRKAAGREAMDAGALVVHSPRCACLGAAPGIGWQVALSTQK